MAPYQDFPTLTSELSPWNYRQLLLEAVDLSEQANLVHEGCPRLWHDSEDWRESAALGNSSLLLSMHVGAISSVFCYQASQVQLCPAHRKQSLAFLFRAFTLNFNLIIGFPEHKARIPLTWVHVTNLPIYLLIVVLLFNISSYTQSLFLFILFFSIVVLVLPHGTAVSTQNWLRLNQRARSHWD